MAEAMVLLIDSQRRNLRGIDAFGASGAVHQGWVLGGVIAGNQGRGRGDIARGRPNISLVFCA